MFGQHEFKPIDIETFLKAMEAARSKVERHERMDLEDLPVGQPLLNPEQFWQQRAADNMSSRMIGFLEFFPDDPAMAMSCEFRRSHVMRLITKRHFRRYRRVNDDGSFGINEAFIKAAAGMYLTMSLLSHPKRLRRELDREVWRQLEIEEREDRQLEKSSGRT